MRATPPPTFNLRAYQSDDLATLVVLFQASVSQLSSAHYNAAQRQAWAPAVADIPAWQTRLSSLELLIAEDSQVIAGFIGFSLDGHIDLLYCAPAYARQGVASALYAAAEQRLRAAGVRFLLATGYSDDSGQFERLGADAVLRKPYGMTDIEKLLGSA